MPVTPYACDQHSWANGESGTADLLNRHPRGVLGGDILTANSTGITGVRTILKVGGGTGPDIVYGDSRIIRVSVYGRVQLNSGVNDMTARLSWSGSEIARHVQVEDVAISGADWNIGFWGMVYPGAAGSASAGCTLERTGAGTVDALAGWLLLVEDVGSTTHLHG